MPIWNAQQYLVEGKCANHGFRCIEDVVHVAHDHTDFLREKMYSAIKGLSERVDNSTLYHYFWLAWNNSKLITQMNMFCV
jgi:hypothetical protein